MLCATRVTLLREMIMPIATAVTERLHAESTRSRISAPLWPDLGDTSVSGVASVTRLPQMYKSHSKYSHSKQSLL